MSADVDDPFRRLTTLNATHERFRKRALVWIKTAGHVPMEKDPKAVAGALAEFFAAEHRRRAL